MSELTIRPSAKFVKAGAILAAIAVVALEIAYWAVAGGDPLWVMLLPPLLMLWPASRWMRRQYTKAVISGDRLRYETGILSRSSRNIQITKIQDVKVDQRFGQRLFDVGDLGIETAGETSRLSLLNVDSPQQLADEIMNRVQKGA